MPSEGAAVPATTPSRSLSEGERAVAKVWQDVLGVGDIRPDDNFFDLGGHSLLLMRVHQILRTSMQSDLPLVALMQYPTVHSLASYLSGTAAKAVVPAAVADRAKKQRDAMRRQQTIREQS